MTIWLTRPAPCATPACRLVCVPHAGAGPSEYAQWPELLGPRVDVCAVQLPGHGARTREPPYREVRRVVEELHAALEPLLDAPIALYGHSMGALIAFELAREMRRRGKNPLWLFVSAYSAPHLPLVGKALHQLPDAEFLDGLVTWYPTHDRAQQEMIAVLLPVLRADFELCERYQHVDEPPLGTPISAFGGISDKEIPKETLAAWSAHTTGPFQLRMIPGDHLFYRGASTRLLRVIDKELTSALENR